MKKFNVFAKILVFALIACLTVCVLVGCGGEKDGDANSTETSADSVNVNMTRYKVKFAKGGEMGKLSSKAIKEQDGGTLYDITITPELGYVIETVKIGGEDVTLKDGKVSKVLKSDVEVEVTYSRKTNDELEARRTKVMDKMKLITGTYFKYDTTFDYIIVSGKNPTIDEGVLYRGMPYSNHPSVSYEVFMSEFVTGPDENGVYTVKDIMACAEAKGIYGNNCADAIYYSWSMVTSTINCVLSGRFSEENGCVNIGSYTVEEDELTKDGGYLSTLAVTERNGLFTMLESYALLAKGDAVMYATNEAGHIVMVDSVKVFRDKKGNINPDKSYIIFYDQNAGYSERTADGKTYMSSCANGEKWTFMKMFTEGYLPVTCQELMDESYEVAKIEMKDSLPSGQHNLQNLTRGYVESNYYISKAQMVITDANGNEVYNATRYKDETAPRRIAYSWFTTNFAQEYKNRQIYNDALDVKELASGTYNCKVTAWDIQGGSYVVRDFQFTK